MSGKILRRELRDRAGDGGADLLHEIYARVLRMHTEHLDEFADADMPLTRRVHGAAADVVETSINNLEDTVIFFRSMHQLDEHKRAEVRKERRHCHERFRDLVKEGQDSGEFRSDVPADLVVDCYFGAVHHLGTWYRTEGPWTPQQIGRHFADLLLAALRPD